MMDSGLRKAIRARLAGAIGPRELGTYPALRPLDERERRKTIGHALLIIGVFVLIAGMYFPDTDPSARWVVFVFAIGYAVVGVWNISRAIRRSKSVQNT